MKQNSNNHHHKLTNPAACPEKNLKSKNHHEGEDKFGKWWSVRINSGQLAGYWTTRSVCVRHRRLCSYSSASPPLALGCHPDLLRSPYSPWIRVGSLGGVHITPCTWHKASLPPTPKRRVLGEHFLPDGFQLLDPGCDYGFSFFWCKPKSKTESLHAGVATKTQKAPSGSGFRVCLSHAAQG